MAGGILGEYFFFRTHPDGRREVSRRIWILIFVTPVLFLLATLWYLAEALNISTGYQRTTGEVVRVYAWEGWNPWDGSVTDYSPVFRYEFRPGEMTEGSGDQSSPNWNFEIGSAHEILFDPDEKGDVIIPGFERLWALPLTLAVLTVVTLAPTLVATHFVRRWLRRGKQA